MKRRDFLKYGGLVAAATVLPVVREDVPPPIYGDGIHDDQPGIQWRLDRGQDVSLSDGYYVVKGPIHLKHNDQGTLRLTNSMIRVEGECAIRVDEAYNRNVVIHGNAFIIRS